AHPAQIQLFLDIC
ncbi:MAG: hypothetical protein EZS28_055877, partial [Streblomastix strix]